MEIGDKVIKRFGLKRVYEVVSEPTDINGVKHLEVRWDGKLYIFAQRNLKKIVL